MSYLIWTHHRLDHRGRPASLFGQIGYAEGQERPEARVPLQVELLGASNVVEGDAVPIAVGQKCSLRPEVIRYRVSPVTVLSLDIPDQELIEILLYVVIMRRVSPRRSSNFHVGRDEAVDGIARKCHAHPVKMLRMVNNSFFRSCLIVSLPNESSVRSQSGGAGFRDVAEPDRVVRIDSGGVVAQQIIIHYDLWQSALLEGGDRSFGEGRFDVSLRPRPSLVILV